MDNLNAYQASSIESEIDVFTNTVKDGKTLANITQLVEEEVQRQLENVLTDFQSCIAQTNLVAIDVMHQELARIKQESTTVSGVMERLKTAVAPDLPQGQDEVVTFREAINNLEKYGNIIPSSGDVFTATVKAQKNHAWDLLKQSLIKMLIIKLEEKFFGNRAIS